MPRPAPGLVRQANPFPGHQPGLDGLRGVAILLVMAFHFLIVLPPTSSASVWLTALLRAGWCGVDLFFVLSGFLITGVLLDAKGSPGFFRTFYARRTLRIFPLYYGVLIATFLVYPLLDSPPSEAYRSLADRQGWLWLYAANWHDGLTGEIRYVLPPWHLDHFWSLAVEEQFYLFWPLAVFLLSRRWLVALCGAGLFGALALRATLTAQGASYLAAYTLTPCRLDGLAVGSFLAILVRRPGAGRMLRLAPVVALASGAALLAIVAWRRGLLHADPVVQTAGYSLLAIFFGSLLVVTLASPPRSPLGRLTRLGVLRFFGKYSYGLYVFHGLILLLVHRWADRLHMTIGGRTAVTSLLTRELLGLALSIGLALLSWHLFEKQFLKLKR
ncbi:MAG TPA: acyltransferase, partial [Gemmataceae bacterium]|nr:acyltransferase [Gemmataceae bacterium]